VREAFMVALADSDLRRSRQLIAEAADAGHTLARLYTDIVRPALERTGVAALDAGASPARRLSFSSVEAALAAVASRPVEGADMHGEGRKALVSVGTAPLDALDGQVIIDVLCGDGWTVSDVEAGADAATVAALATEQHVELVVMPTCNAADLLQSALTYTALRRMADPPVIVACSFGHPDETRRARAAGADVFVSDPDDLMRHVRRSLPTLGARNWGVRLRRRGATLVVAPTGDLDAESVGRLRQVVESRAGTFQSLVVDTRDVASVREPGMEALLAWIGEAATAGRTHRVLPGELFGAALHGTVLDADLLAVAADAG
jgi:hypothetical protein